MTADRSWLYERPEPSVQQAMATEAGIERRRAALAGEPHRLDCTCRECVIPDPPEYDHDAERDSLLPTWTHEYGNAEFADELERRAHDLFISICAEQVQS